MRTRKNGDKVGERTMKRRSLDGMAISLQQTLLRRFTFSRMRNKNPPSLKLGRICEKVRRVV
jgi:hypothetical protein